MRKQVQLSERLQAVVELVTKGKSVADVGCDHAYISIYMIEQGIAEHVIAMDVNRGPLQRAKENIQKYAMQDKIETRLSDGIKELKKREVHTVLIAGMGGPLMQQILLGNPSVLEDVEELILQPQSEIADVRRFLEQISFQIEKENMVFEDGKYYVMMRARRSSQVEPMKKEIQYRYGQYLIEHKNPILSQYLHKECRQLEQIQDKLKYQDSEKGKQKIKELQKDITYCKEALSYYECGTDY